VIPAPVQFADAVARVHLAQARRLLATAIRRRVETPQVLVLDLDDALARDLYDAYCPAGVRVAEVRSGTVAIVALSLGAADRFLAAPLHGGDRGVFWDIRAHILGERSTLVAIAGGGVQCLSLSPATPTEAAS
jgi:hypothetical protein